MKSSVPELGNSETSRIGKLGSGGPLTWGEIVQDAYSADQITLLIPSNTLFIVGPQP